MAYKRKWPKELEKYEKLADEINYVYAAFKTHKQLWGNGFPKPDPEDGSVGLPHPMPIFDLFVYFRLCEKMQPGYMEELLAKVKKSIEKEKGKPWLTYTNSPIPQ